MHVQHDKTKRLEIDSHFIKEKLDSGLIATTCIPSDFLKTKHIITLNYVIFSNY